MRWLEAKLNTPGRSVRRCSRSRAAAAILVRHSGVRIVLDDVYCERNENVSETDYRTYAAVETDLRDKAAAVGRETLWPGSPATRVQPLVLINPLSGICSRGSLQYAARLTEGGKESKLIIWLT